MKRLLRNRATGLFLAADLRWTDKITDALAFASVSELLQAANNVPARDLLVYYAYDDQAVSCWDISFPVRRHPCALPLPCVQPQPRISTPA